MSSERLIALVVLGKQKLTRLAGPLPGGIESLDALARQVARRPSDRTYYVAEVDKKTGGSRRKHLLYVWHVGEGFTHEQGWWVHMDD